MSNGCIKATYVWLKTLKIDRWCVSHNISGGGHNKTLCSGSVISQPVLQWLSEVHCVNVFLESCPVPVSMLKVT